MNLFISGHQSFVRKTDYVVETIRTSILLGYIRPGTTITERQIRETLRVSSSPVREALNQLEAEGLLTRNPHVGTKVAEIDIDDARELYSIQGLLQGSAVQICAKKLSKDDIGEAEKLNDRINEMISNNVDVDTVRILNYKFHMIVCGASIYPWLTRLISALWIKLPRQTVWSDPREAKVAVRYHKRIIEAIKVGDPMLSGALMRRHLQRSKRILYG